MKGITKVSTFSEELHKLFRWYLEFQRKKKRKALVMEIRLFFFPLLQEGLFESTTISH